jgi:hypothetical protein
LSELVAVGTLLFRAIAAACPQPAKADFASSSRRLASTLLRHTVTAPLFLLRMKPSVIVWDLETVPDLPGFAASNDLVGKSDADIREALAAALDTSVARLRLG